MKLAWHIVRKDLRRLRWPLAGWLLVIALKLGVGFVLVLGGGLGAMPFSQIWQLNRGLLGVELLLTFVLTAMLLQEDSLVGTTPFWITRPISGRRLLGAKLAGWLLLLWMPAVAITLPWWLTCGFGPREIALAALELLAFHAVVSLPAALVAAVTDSLGRFLIWSFVLLAAMTAIPGVIAFGMSDRMSNALLSPFAIAGWSTFAITVLVVIAHQFLRRDIVRTLAWLAVGALVSPLVAMTVASGWFRFASPGSKSSDWHPERAKDITLAFREFSGNSANDSSDGAWLRSQFEVRGLPRVLALDGGAWAKQTWSWAGGPVVSRPAISVEAWQEDHSVRAALGLAEQKPDAETAKHDADLHEARIVKWLAAHPERSRPLELPPITDQVEVTTGVFPSTIKRIERTPPVYEAGVQLRLLRPELRLEVPLNDGGWHASAAHGFRVGPAGGGHYADERANDAHSSWLPLVATMPDFFWDMLPDPSHWLNDDWRGAGLYLVNRTDGDVLRQFVRTEPSLTIGSVEIMRTAMHALQPEVWRAERWLLRDPNWLAGATVTIVSFREEARFTAEVKAERFENPK